MTASWGAVKRCQNICIYFLTENPEENGVNGALESEKKSENRICSRSDDRGKVAAQEKKKNPIGNLALVSKFLPEIRSLEALLAD